MDKGDRAGWRIANYKAAAEKLKARLTKRGAAASHGPRPGSTAGRAGGGGSPNDKQAWLSIIKVLKAKELLPCSKSTVAVSRRFFRVSPLPRRLALQ